MACQGELLLVLQVQPESRFGSHVEQWQLTNNLNQTFFFRQLICVRRAQKEEIAWPIICFQFQVELFIMCNIENPLKVRCKGDVAFTKTIILK